VKRLNVVVKGALCAKPVARAIHQIAGSPRTPFVPTPVYRRTEQFICTGKLNIC
jgi:hypothetical protein